jgi:hypothetical protein
VIRKLDGAKWERSHPQEAEALRRMEGRTAHEMAEVLGVGPSTVKGWCRAIGVRYERRSNPTHAPKSLRPPKEWKPPEQYPSVFHFAHGVTLRQMQGARA